MNKLSDIAFNDVCEYYSLDDCSREEPQCSYVAVVYPAADLEKFKDALRLNHQIKADVLGLLWPVSTNIHEDNIAVISKGFLDRYRRVKKEFPKTGQRWYIRLTGTVAWQSNEFLTVRFSYHDYTGGAHANYALFYKIYDKKRGHQAVLTDVVNDTAKLRKLGEMKFRKLKQIGKDSPMEKTKFSFPGKTFSLNNDFGLDSMGLVFVYNPYEIAAYSEGATELRFSYDELDGLLKSDVN